MDSKVRLSVWLAVLVAAVAAGYYLNTAKTTVTQAPSTTAPAKYVFIAGGSDPYWKLCVAGAREAANRLEAEIEIMTPESEDESGLKDQLGWLAQAAAERPDGVAIGPIDPSRQTTLINSLAESTTVVTVDSDAPNSRRMFYVGASNYEAGRTSAQLVREALPEGGKVAILVGTLSKTNAAERKQGIEEALAEPADASSAAYQVVPTELDNGEAPRCAEIVRETLAAHPDLGAIVCTFGYHGPIALEILQAEGASGSVKVIAFDEDDRVLDGIRDGRVHATIAQDPYMFGFEAINKLEDVRSGRYLSLPVAGRVDVGVHCIAVDSGNLDDFQARLAQRLGSASAGR